MSIYRALSLLGFLLLIAACTKWPPHASEARQIFAENQESFERIAEKMRSTDYWRVGLGWSSRIEVMRTIGSIPEEIFEVSEDLEWAKLLQGPGLTKYTVVQEDNAISIGEWIPGTRRENRNLSVAYTHDLNMLDDFILCRPEHENIECGKCAMALEDDWYVSYKWSPRQFSPADRDISEAYFSGEISEEEYSLQLDANMRPCYVEGYSEMGYDVDVLFGPDNN